MQFPDIFLRDIQLAHPSWHSILHKGLLAVHQQNPEYLPHLAQSSFLPDQHRLFAAFSIPITQVNFVLVGEGPYPRSDSATGYCFMDGAVDGIWSTDPNGGLSKAVNRATSLRNFLKMLLVADQQISQSNTSGAALIPVAQRLRADSGTYVQTMSDVQINMLRQGFLLLNASLVFRVDVAPVIDARAWLPFLDIVFKALLLNESRPALILWGKIADRLEQVPAVTEFNTFKSEHPYNLSFIANLDMQNLFAPLHLLRK